MEDNVCKISSNPLSNSPIMIYTEKCFIVISNCQGYSKTMVKTSIKSKMKS